MAVGPLPKEALDYFESKRLEPAFSYLDVWRDEHNHAFTIAKVMEHDILRDMQKLLADNLRNGGDFREFRDQALPLLTKAGWLPHAKRDGGIPRRLEVIYDTNMRMARAAAQWERLERNKKALPYLLYQLGSSEFHRPEHVSWAGTILPTDHPWWQTHMPPNGYGCKCHVRSISKDEFEISFGGTIIEPEDFGSSDFVNKRTGQTGTVPIGIDPGFDHNPGMRVKAPKEEGSKETQKPARLLKLEQLLLTLVFQND